MYIHVIFNVIFLVFAHQFSIRLLEHLRDHSIPATVLLAEARGRHPHFIVPDERILLKNAPHADAVLEVIRA